MLQRTGFVPSWMLIALTATLLCAAGPASAARFVGASPVSDAKLASLRGGFSFGSGNHRFHFWFGIQQMTFINHKLVNVRQIVNTATGGGHDDLPVDNSQTNTSVSNNQVGSPPNNSQVSTTLSGNVHIIQGGSGNVVQDTALHSGALATVIQNNLDNQVIQNMTIYNIKINSTHSAQRLTLHDAIRDALTGMF